MTEQNTTPETDKPSLDEVLNSLTGYDEIAISKAFGRDFVVMLDSEPITLSRALIFVLNRRAGSSDKDAKHAAMNLPLGTVNNYFAEEPEQPELDPESPETAAGEGDSQPA